MAKKSMSESALERALAEEIQETIRVKQACMDLLDALRDASLYLLNQSERQGIDLINADRFKRLLAYAETLYARALPTKLEQPDSNNRRWNRTDRSVLYL